MLVLSPVGYPLFTPAAKEKTFILLKTTHAWRDRLSDDMPLLVVIWSALHRVAFSFNPAL